MAAFPTDRPPRHPCRAISRSGATGDRARQANPSAARQERIASRCGRDGIRLFRDRRERTSGTARQLAAGQSRYRDQYRASSAAKRSRCARTGGTKPFSVSGSSSRDDQGPGRGGGNAGRTPHPRDAAVRRAPRRRRLPPGGRRAPRTGPRPSPGSADRTGPRPRGRPPNCSSGSAAGAGRSWCWP